MFNSFRNSSFRNSSFRNSTFSQQTKKRNNSKSQPEKKTFKQLQADAEAQQEREQKNERNRRRKEKLMNNFITDLRDFNQNRLLNEKIVIQRYNTWLNQQKNLNSVSLHVYFNQLMKPTQTSMYNRQSTSGGLNVIRNQFVNRSDQKAFDTLREKVEKEHKGLTNSFDKLRFMLDMEKPCTTNNNNKNKNKKIELSEQKTKLATALSNAKGTKNSSKIRKLLSLINESKSKFGELKNLNIQKEKIQEKYEKLLCETKIMESTFEHFLLLKKLLDSILVDSKNKIIKNNRQTYSKFKNPISFKENTRNDTKVIIKNFSELIDYLKKKIQLKNSKVLITETLISQEFFKIIPEEERKIIIDNLINTLKKMETRLDKIVKGEIKKGVLRIKQKALGRDKIHLHLIKILLGLLNDIKKIQNQKVNISLRIPTNSSRRSNSRRFNSRRFNFLV